jgi:hypothetical protein
MTTTYLSWDIIEDGKQVGATDRALHAEAMRAQGYGLLVHQTLVDVTTSGVKVLSSVTTYLGPKVKV